MYSCLCLNMIKFGWLLTVWLNKLLFLMVRIMICISKVLIYILSLFLSHWINLFNKTDWNHYIFFLFYLIILIIFLIWLFFIILCWRFIFNRISATNRIPLLILRIYCILYVCLRWLKIIYFWFTPTFTKKGSKFIEII
jgi:hypothetical protein